MIFLHDVPASSLEAPSLNALLVGALQFIYDAWYAYLTPDREFPREVRGMLNRAFGELAHAARALDLRQLLLGYPPISVLSTLRLSDTAAGFGLN